MSDERHSQQATLGCGTLILIGIVVILVTHGGFGEIDDSVSRLRNSVDGLRVEVQQLEQKIDKLTERLAAPEKKREAK